jgi:hypothetical protein
LDRQQDFVFHLVERSEAVTGYPPEKIRHSFPAFAVLNTVTVKKARRLG